MLNVANQMAANESEIFKRVLILAFCFLIGVQIRQCKMAASLGIAPRHPVSETGALLVMQQGYEWSPEKELHPQHLFVGET